MEGKFQSVVKVNGLILSAGLSSRMGEFKPLLLYDGKPFIATILNKLSIVCSSVGIVTGYKKSQVEEVIHKSLPDTKTVKLIHNEKFENDMFSSLQAGLKKMQDCDWLIYHFVDQPHIPEKFYTDFVSQLDESYNWIQPVHNGKKGHPIMLHNSIFSTILLSDNTSLKEISRSPKVKKKFWDCTYPQILDDIDTKENYQRLI